MFKSFFCKPIQTSDKGIIMEQSVFNFKEIQEREERLAPGHRMCAGCGGTIAVRNVLKALHPGDKAVVGNATGCLEVSTYTYPYTAYTDSYIHTAFESAGATLSGAETAFKALNKRGKIDETYKFITFGGDGGTYDIGLQSLSGAMERGHDMVYVCYDNEAYMNTGIQKSGLTPFGAKTTTTPAGRNIHGNIRPKKNMFEIAAAHDIPYAATASVGYLPDFIAKVKKASQIQGTKDIHVIAPCPTGWGVAPDETVEIAKEVVDSGLWYLAEYENGRFTLNHKPREFTSVEAYLKKQGRFKHLDDEDIRVITESRDKKWEHINSTFEYSGK